MKIAQLATHNQTNKCNTKPNPIVVDGRTYLKGKSPFEGVWHDTHIPYDIHEVNKNKQGKLNCLTKPIIEN